MRDVHVLDVTLRDGSHSMQHSYTEAQVRSVARGLNKAGIEYFEVSHGDGLGVPAYNTVYQQWMN